MAVDYGTDVRGIFSMGTRASFVSGRLNLGMALARRLITDRGTLLYDLDYGFNLRAYINAPMTPAIRSFVEGSTARECEKDPRVLQCAATVTWNFVTQVTPVSLEVTTDDGPFALVLSISQVNVQILNQQQLAA
jgi:phage baseplate assembly protein W